MKYVMLLVLFIVCESMQITDASSTSSEKLNAQLVCGSFSHPNGTESNRITIALGKSDCVGTTGPSGLKGSKVISNQNNFNHKK